MDTGQGNARGNKEQNLTITQIVETSILNGVYVCDSVSFDEIYVNILKLFYTYFCGFQMHKINL